MNQIRNRLGVLACAALLTLAGTANAATFDLSYNFASGDTLTGTLDGTLDGAYIEGISNVHLTLDGTAFTGTLGGYAWDTSAGTYTSAAPIVSTDMALNNFVLADSNVGAGDYSTLNNYLTIVNDPVNGSQVTAINFVSGQQASESPVAGSWSLVAAPVPEPASLSLLMAGFGLLGLVARRRRSV